MRPLALAAVLVALAGCSLNYADKTFKATPKNNEMPQGEERPVNDQKAEHEPTDPAGGHMGEEANAGPTFEQTQPVVRTSASFPKGVQPTGKPPVIESPTVVEGHPSWEKPSGE